MIQFYNYSQWNGAANTGLIHYWTNSSRPKWWPSILRPVSSAGTSNEILVRNLTLISNKVLYLFQVYISGGGSLRDVGHERHLKLGKEERLPLPRHLSSGGNPTYDEERSQKIRAFSKYPDPINHHL